MKYDIAVIGGGPAGLTSALYAARGGLSVALFEKQGVGGQAALTSEIENYPGFDAVSGFELTLKMEEQAKRFGAEFVFDEVLKLELSSAPKKIVTATETYEADAVILCMGATPRKLGVERENEFIGSGVSYCATCDGAFFRNKTVAVNGGGNTAAEDALYLERFAKEVYVIHRRDEFRATKILADRIIASPKIKVVWNSVVKKLNGENKLESVTLSNVKTGEETDLALNGLFVAIGQLPSASLADGVERDGNGYILTKDDMSTNLDGVYAAGDVRQKSLRQVVTACSDGAIAAESASKHLAELKK